MIETRTVTRAEELESLAPAWWSLWRRCPDATPFTAPAWLLPWWRAFAPGELRAVAAWRGERLVGLVPAYLETGPLGRRLLPLGIGISDVLDVLLDPEEDGAAAALTDAAAALPDWDVWELEALPDAALSLRLPPPPGCRAELHGQDARPVLRLDAADPLRPVPSGKRRKLRMARHRLARRGGELQPVGSDDIPHFVDELERLHGRRWAARGEPGLLGDARVLRFHREALPLLAEAGLAQLSRCVVEDRAIGVYYGLRHGRRAYAYLGGFDPDFAFESPGTILVGEAIEQAALAGCEEFDFLRGAEPYKYEWGAQDQRNLHRRILRGPAGE